MSIQWFPGHMTSARKKAAETMASIDVVIEVLDARLPEASTNPLVRELRMHRQRPCLKVLNKADLAQTAPPRCNLVSGRCLRQGAQIPDHRHRWLLRPCCKRPSRRRPCNYPDDISSSHYLPQARGHA